MTRLAPATALSLLVLALAVVACGTADGGTGTASEPLDASTDSADTDVAFTDRMAAEHRTDHPGPSPAAATEPAGPVTEEWVEYATIDGKPIRGLLARPENASAPGILVIHEWWGLNENVQAMARRLAGEGYAALAVDLYQGEVATDSDQARALMSASMERQAASDENLRQAYAFLAERGAPRIGVIGWCFGGGWSLNAALLMPSEIDAAVIYYGRLVTDRERLSTLQMPILGLFGADDSGIPVESVRAFESALRELGKEASVHVYEGAGHAFANPSGGRYDKKAAEDAWTKTLAFFDRNLRPAGEGR